MAINRRTWPRPVNYVRRSTDYDAAAASRERDVSSGRRLIDADASSKKMERRPALSGNSGIFPFVPSGKNTS